MRHYRVLEELKRYDALLAISEATRRDCLRLLGVAADRVTTIGAASDERFFTPDRSEPPSAASRSLLKGLGINRPFVLNVGGFDVRKNLWMLIDAFALLPEPLRRELQFVMTFTVLDSDRDRLLRHARAAGLGDALVVTGEVSDAALKVLYQRCAAFVFPSLYEGFGLPLLEAMHCGAAVVAGNNSSQVEVVGEAGLLANASDACDIAAKLARVLEDPELGRVLRTRAVVQAGQFSWSATAARATAVLESLPPSRPVAPLVPRPLCGGAQRGRGSPSFPPSRPGNRGSPITPPRSSARSSRPTRSTSTTSRVTSPSRRWPREESRAATHGCFPARRRCASTTRWSTRWATRAITTSCTRRCSVIRGS